MTETIVNTAIRYTHRGWRVVPIPRGAKKPVIARWQQLRLREGDLPKYFCPSPHNIGVLLGEPSNRLIDVDLDHAVALEIANDLLPPTGAIFGRRGKPRSHWLYYATYPVPTRQWRLPGAAKLMIVELRSTGGQTVFPGSLHPSGEAIWWDCDKEPARVDPNFLQDQLQKLFDEVCRGLGENRSEASSRSLRPHHTAPPTIVERARQYLAKIPPAVSGQGGHNATFYAACTLVIGFGLDRKSALALLCRWNELCQPPWSEKELAHKVDEALKQPGWRGYLLARSFRRTSDEASSAIARANHHAVEHRRRARRRAHA